MPSVKNIAPKKNRQIEASFNEHFNIVIVFIIVLFLLGAYMFLIKPKFDSTLISIKDSISQQEQFYLAQKQRLVDLKAATALYSQLEEEDIKKVLAVLPNEYAKEKLFGELEDIVSQQGVLLSSVNLVKAGEDIEAEDEPLAAKSKRFIDLPNAQNIGVIQINMSLAAIDYAALKSLLPILESHLQIMDIQFLSLDPEEKTAELEIFTYYFK